MAKNIDIEIRNLKETQAKMEQVAVDLHGRPMVNAMKTATLIVQRDAKKNAPVDTGRLRASITPDIRVVRNDIHGIVGSNIHYAPYMELGTRPHWPPISALETWARRHGTTAFVIARAIARHGTKARKFLQNAFEDNRQRIVKILEKGVKGIVDK